MIDGGSTRHTLLLDYCLPGLRGICKSTLSKVSVRRTGYSTTLIGTRPVHTESAALHDPYRSRACPALWSGPRTIRMVFCIVLPVLNSDPPSLSATLRRASRRVDRDAPLWPAGQPYAPVATGRHLMHCRKVQNVLLSVFQQPQVGGSKIVFKSDFRAVTDAVTAARRAIR
jgi:hypothetical protein